MTARDLVAVVSGGSRGLGSAVVDALLADGHPVATFSRTETAVIERCRERAGDRYHWQAVDAEDPDAVRAFAGDVVRRFGHIDVLVNNAAVAPEAVVALAPPADIRRALTVNLESVIHLTQAVTRAMLRQRSGGVIINISSIVGLRGYAGLSVYSSTKAALDGFTRSLARELGSRGIRANSVAPGFLETELSSSLDEAQRRQIARRTPLGRLGRAEDVIGLIRFLVSPAAGFITGQTFVVDGGITC